MEGWHRPGRTVELHLADDILLPLAVVWPAGVSTTTVDRLRAALPITHGTQWSDRSTS
ncbi:hypothetical protein L083_4903 [Actinoplanes sp. N902-109]|nr:hypothetical protein L083_4903 [Actinoplanes sp. N902-109]